MKRFRFDKPLVESKYQPSRTDVYWVDINESTGKISTIKKFSKGQWIDYMQFVPEPLEPEPFVGPANNEIWYTTVDGQPFDVQSVIDYASQDMPYSGPNVVSNVFDYNKNVYIMTFDSTITCVGPTVDPIKGEMVFDAVLIADPNNSESPIFSNVLLPQSVTRLGYLAYFNTTLEEITIPKSVTTFGQMTIYSNRNLKKLILPNTLTKIPLTAIYNNPELQVIEFQGTVEQWNNIEKDTMVSDDGEIITWIADSPLVVEVQCTDGNVPIL